MRSISHRVDDYVVYVVEMCKWMVLYGDEMKGEMDWWADCLKKEEGVGSYRISYRETRVVC